MSHLFNQETRQRLARNRALQSGFILLVLLLVVAYA
jgi:hypothetical protein